MDKKPLIPSVKSFFGATGLTPIQYRTILVTKFKEDSLFRNSLYLLASTIMMSLFGLIFWIITTRLYSADQIGLATAVISATTLLASFSMFGFNTGLVRYLPKSEDKNATINTVITVVSLLSVLASIVYVVGIGYFAPQFSALKTQPAFGALFIFFMLVVSINMLTDSFFIAYRAAKYNFIVYLCFGSIKIILPLLFIRFPINGVLASYIGSVFIAFIVTFYFMIRSFGYKFKPLLRMDLLKNMAGFSVGNYIATFITGFPALALPTIIVAKIGTAPSAYFYIASTIAALLYGIPQAISQSLLAEGSHASDQIKSLVRNAVKLIGILLIVGISLCIVFGKYVLLIFGKAYATNSSLLLSVLAITGVFTAINIVSSTVLRVLHNIRALIIISIGYLVVTMGLIFLLIPHGIIGAGIALLVGQAFMSVEFGVLYLFRTILSRS